MSELRYYIEKLTPIKATEWVDEDCDTFAWVKVNDIGHGSITIARAYANTNYDERLSYRITDGGRYWSI